MTPTETLRRQLDTAQAEWDGVRFEPGPEEECALAAANEALANRAIKTIVNRMLDPRTHLTLDQLRRIEAILGEGGGSER